MKEQATQPLFSPVRVGTLELKNRLIFAPIGVSLSSRERYLDFLVARARGGASLVMTAPGLLMRDAPDSLLRIYSDEFIPGLKRIASAVHAQGARVGIQVEHQGRQSHFPDVPVAPSAIPCPVTKRMPRELTVSEIEAMAEEHAEGVRRARDAGFDLAEIHAAHGYLVSQFLSPRSNQRTDEYGGDIRRRARFLTDILRRARQKVGPSFPISCRINGSDNIEGGLPLEDVLVIAKLVEEAGADLINVSGGVYGSYPVTIAPFYAPPGLYADIAARIKQLVRIPVGVAARIESLELAESILRENKADLIALGRPLIADPELPAKARRGDRDDIRPCIYCNQGCMKELDEGKPATCTVNPQVGREADPVVKASQPKNIMVIGGGLAGLEAAWAAARRGHRVTLFEKDQEFGGQWCLAAAPPFKQGFLTFLAWLIRQALKEGVQLRLGQRATPETVARERPGVVILATGAHPIIPSIQGADGAITAWEVIRNSKPVGDKVVVVGGNSVGLETAHYLASRGKKVTVLEMQNYIGTDMSATVRWHLRRLLDGYGVQALRSTRLKEIRPDGLLVETKDGDKTLPPANTVVLAVGSRSNNESHEAIRALAPEVYVIGDAARARNGLEAIREGWEIGCKV